MLVSFSSNDKQENENGNKYKLHGGNLRQMSINDWLAKNDSYNLARVI